MFGYNPYGAYSSPYGYGPYSSPDTDYLRALAQERAAQEQLLAARRAQEEARQRAERARLVQSRYGLPSAYNSLYDDDLDAYEAHDSYDGGYIPYGVGGYTSIPRQRQAALAQERQRALQRELERRERERDERLRLEEERRQLEEERKRLMEEERMQRLRAEELRRREQEYNRTRQFDSLFGRTPDDDEEMVSNSNIAVERQADLHPQVSPRTGRRPQIIAPSRLRGTASKGKPVTQPYLKPNDGASRSSSVPPRSVAPPGPIRPSVSSSTAATGHFKVPIRTPSPKQQASPPKAQATPEQHEAARKIQEAYRAHASRALALRTIDNHRTKFAHLKAGFCFPPSLDFATAPGTHDHVSVPVDPAALAALLADGVSVEEGRSRRPQLAYTSQNAPVHAYLEELNRLLSALDAVESGGDKEVRERRKGVVREVEAEAERVEAVVGEVWSRWQARQESGGQQAEVAVETSQVVTEQPTAVQEMSVVEEPSPDAQPESNQRVAPVLCDAVPQATVEQQDEKRMDVEQDTDHHADDEASLDAVPHVEPTDQNSAGESSSEVDRAEGGDKMQVEPSQIAPSTDVPTAPMDTDVVLPAEESALSLSVGTPDAEPEEEGGSEDVCSPVPREVEAPPTPEIEIKDADEEDAAHSPTEPSQSATPALRPLHGNAESDEGSEMPSMKPSPHIVVF